MRAAVAREPQFFSPEPIPCLHRSPPARTSQHNGPFSRDWQKLIEPLIGNKQASKQFPSVNNAAFHLESKSLKKKKKAIMAGGLVKYRHLSRDSSARKALLRGLVTQLVQYEHIQTTHAKAKEAQRLAEKLITLAKKNNEPCRRSAQGILYVCHRFFTRRIGHVPQ